MYRWLQTPSLVLLLALLAPVPQAAAIDAARQAELTEFVRQDCGSCHGMTLQGGLGKPLLPENLKDTESEGLASIILDGVPGTPMPPWRGLLTEEEARWIADKLREGLPR